VPFGAHRGKENHIPDVRDAGEVHQEAVDADPHPTGWRHAVFEGAEVVLVHAGRFFVAGRAFSGVVAVAFLVASWVMFGRPFFRSRYRKALGKNLPTWNLKADQPR